MITSLLVKGAAGMKINIDIGYLILYILRPLAVYTCIFKCLFFNENYRILITISPEFVPKDLIDYDLPLARVMTIGVEQATGQYLIHR